VCSVTCWVSCGYRSSVLCRRRFWSSLGYIHMDSAPESRSLALLRAALHVGSGRSETGTEEFAPATLHGLIPRARENPSKSLISKNGRGERIRTSDPVVPNEGEPHRFGVA
jgi:hypothetical protein